MTLPIHKSIKTRYENKKVSVTLLGDAALQIKNTTGGGIIPGMKAASILAKNYKNYESNLFNLKLAINILGRNIELIISMLLSNIEKI